MNIERVQKLEVVDYIIQSVLNSDVETTYFDKVELAIVTGIEIDELREVASILQSYHINIDKESRYRFVVHNVTDNYIVVSKVDRDTLLYNGATDECEVDSIYGEIDYGYCVDERDFDDLDAM